MGKLDKLLNSLVKSGWDPRGYEIHGIHCGRNRFTLYLPNMRQGNYSIRDLVSKSSGLWQFVYENGMIKEEHKHERILDPTFGEGWADCKRQEHDGNYGYRLIESTLKDESELEDFLLQNIKIDG